MIDEPRVTTTSPQHYAFVHLEIPVAEIQRVMMPTMGEVTSALKAQGVSPSGPWFTHHRRRPASSFDFEICFPVAAAIEPAGRVEAGFWPARTVARTVFHGAYQELPHAWGKLEAWMKEQGLVGVEEFWEVYVTSPGDTPDAAAWRTELNWPVE